MKMLRSIVGVLLLAGLPVGPASAADPQGGQHHMDHGAMNQGGMDHGAMGQGDMSAMHDQMQARLADTSGFGERGSAKGKVRIVKIDATDFRFSEAALKVKVGETVRFVISNKSEQAHDFTIGDAAYLDASRGMMEHMAAMGMDPASPEHLAMHGKSGNAVVIPGGETREIFWKFIKAGKFAFACTVPGHSASGMTGTIQVD